MASRSKLLSIDAFAKTVEDARIKTASGGIITLVCVLVVLILIRNEYLDYKLVITRPELVVDKDMNSKLSINLDVSFPNLPCDLFSPHIVDVSGDNQLDILESGFKKYRIILSNEEILDDADMGEQDIPLEELLKGLGPDQKDEYCGTCHGALPQDQHEYCCNSCAAVRAAYAYRSWAFYDGENIEQCEKEGYVSRVTQRIQANEGCRIRGTAQVNRISGNLHFAPGPSRIIPGKHYHDLSLYNKYPEKFNFDHFIHHLSFGSEPKQLAKSDDSSHSLNNAEVFLGKKQYVTSYFLKVVATRYEYLNAEDSLDTNQFSITFHHRPLSGGKDEDHGHTLHPQGGIPGVFFHFDISPLKIINREEFAKTWSGFVLGVFSSIASVLMLGTLVDRSVWAAEKAIKGKKDM